MVVFNRDMDFLAGRGRPLNPTCYRSFSSWSLSWYTISDELSHRQGLPASKRGRKALMEPQTTPDGQADLPRQVVRSIGSGILLMTFFAAYWAFVGGTFVGGVLQWIIYGIATALTLAFFAAGLYVLRA